MFNLFKFGFTGAKIHATIRNPDGPGTGDVSALCGKRESAPLVQWKNDILLIAEEDLCGTCFIPGRLQTFRRMKDEARVAARDPIDSLDVHEARDALKRLRRETEEGFLGEEDFKRLLRKPVSGTLTITIDLFNLDPKVRDFSDTDFLEGFVDEVYVPLSRQWHDREVDLCWWTPEAKEGDFDDAAQVASVEFESND